MILRLTNNVARCITLMLCVGPAAVILAQTSSPAPTGFATSISPPTNPPTAISTVITPAPTEVSTVITPAPTEVSTVITPAPTEVSINTIAPTTSAPISAAPTTEAPVSLAPTAAVIVPATLAPVTAAPTTASPVTLPPTLPPFTVRPTLYPTDIATTLPPTLNTVITDAPVTAAPTTISNSTLPTPPPTVATPPPTIATPPPTIATTAPTNLPSAAPTSKPTTVEPTASPSLTPSTSAPTATSESPSETAQTRSPTIKIETQSPTSIVTPIIINNLKMTLTGTSRINDPSKWSSVTSEFFKTQYINSEQMFNIEVRVTHTSEKLISTRNRGRMMMRGRGLQTDSVEVTYKQNTSYSTSDSALTLDDVLQIPLMNAYQQDAYMSELKKFGGYQSLSAVSTISLPSDDSDATEGGNDAIIDPETSDDSSFPVWAKITIVVGGAALLICIIPFVLRKCRSTNSQQSDIAPPHHIDAGEETLETTDYDYSKAYEAAGNFSLSDAGGTLGQRSRNTGGSELMQQSGNNTIFSEDPTYDEGLYDKSRREEMIDVYAPAGKLGVVIDTPNDGAPIVHAVKDSSPIATKIQVGDRLVAVDDQDVRTMTAIQVSKLISKKSVNASRKMTVIRHV